MAEHDLLLLHRLHQIDYRLVEVQKKTSALKQGEAMASRLEILRAEAAAKDTAFREAHARQRDRELTAAQIQDKLASIDKQFFGAVTPKEAEALEAQKRALKSQLDTIDTDILECMELLPGLQSAAEAAKKLVEAKQRELEEWKVKAAAFRQQLAGRQKELMDKRPAIAAKVPASLLAKYDAIRKAHGGIGMALVTEDRTCEECGTAVSERLLSGLSDLKIVTCEECHRILYLPGAGM